VHGLSIPRAITFEREDASGVEILTTLTGIEHHLDHTITADFSVYSVSRPGTGTDHDMELAASGAVRILLGASDPAALPCPAGEEDYNMSEVEPDRVYAAFSRLGYGYMHQFRGLSSTKRRLNRAIAAVDTYAYSDDESTSYLVHPAMLDVAFQLSMLAYSSPGDGRLWALHVPTRIGAIRINPGLCSSLPTSGTRVPASATLNHDSEDFSADIDILSEDGQQGMIRVEDLVLKPFAPATGADDRCMFSSTKLDVAVPDLSLLADAAPAHPSRQESEVATDCERISYYYLRKWKSEVTDHEWVNSGHPHHAHLRDFVEHTLSCAARGRHPTLKREWASDSTQDIHSLISRHSNDITVRLLSAAGDNLPAAVRGQTMLLEHLERDGMLGEYYSNLPGLQTYHSLLASVMKQMTHRYPHARILELSKGFPFSPAAAYSATKN